MKGIVREWDRILVYILFILFGVHTLLYPILSVRNNVIRPLETLLSIEFMISGISLLVGLCTGRRWMRSMGLTVAFIGLATISGVIGFAGGWRTLAYAMLIGAFATECIIDLRRSKRRISREKFRDELQEIAQEAKIDEEERP